MLTSINSLIHVDDWHRGSLVSTYPNLNVGQPSRESEAKYSAASLLLLLELLASLLPSGVNIRVVEL